MKIIVVYESSTGFTKQYANWIAEELNCQAISTKEMKNEDIDGYDIVIFGGWIMGNGIVGYDKIKDKNVKKLIVFGVGASENSEEVHSTIINQNHLGDLPFFYFPGGMKPDQLNFFVRLMLKQIKKSIAKKKEKTKQDEYMERVLCTNFDASDRKYIQNLVKLVKEGDHDAI